MKSCHIMNPAEIQVVWKIALKEVICCDFHKLFEWEYKYWQKCIAAEEQYFEGSCVCLQILDRTPVNELFEATTYK